MIAVTRRSAFIRLLIGLVTCALVGGGGSAAAQTREAGRPGEPSVFPHASFEAMFRKFASPTTDFSRLYSWDAHMALDVTVLRLGRDAIRFRSTFQTVGTENVGEQISVGGTGYILGLGYTHAYSPEFSIGTGLLHLSSHLTRDLDAKLEEIRLEGGLVPDVIDPPEYNVVFFSAQRKLPTIRFAPELEIAIEPVNFRFNGGPAGEVRPVYIGSRSTLWRGTGKSLVARTQHEIGTNFFNYFSVVIQLDGTSQPEGRLQLFVGGSPGHQLHVSPNVGALRDGLAVGVRMAFGA
jgi:hypothetical protein